MSNLKNAIWKQLSFRNNHGVLNKESRCDFVLNVKETINHDIFYLKLAKEQVDI